MAGLETVLGDIMSLLTGGLTSIATGIGGGLGNLVKSIFLEVNESGEAQGLSLFGGVIIIFAGVGLAIGLSRWVVNWVTSLGN